MFLNATRRETDNGRRNMRWLPQLSVRAIYDYRREFYDFHSNRFRIPRNLDSRWDL